MSDKRITFDTTSGTPSSVNLTINTGSTFLANFSVVNTSSSAFNFSGWTGSSQMAKSVSIGSSSYAVATFGVGFSTSTQGRFNISLGSTQTRSLKEGRYVYDILVSSGSTVYRIVEGNILVKPGISSAP
jgi:hypothetical protein